MSHQVFLSPSNGRSNRSFSGSSLPLCSTYPGDRRAQQALYMGCPPGNTNMVSFSPGGEHDRLCIQSSGSSFTPISMHPPPQQSTYLPSQPRFMYPTSYCPGNPGFYYDLLQNSSHTATQTIMPYPPSTDCATSTSVLLHLHIYLHLCIPRIFHLIHQFILVTFTLGIHRQQMSIVRPLFLMVYHPTHQVFRRLNIVNCCQILL